MVQVLTAASLFSTVHRVKMVGVPHALLFFCTFTNCNNAVVTADYGPLFSFVPDLLRPEAILSEPLDSVQCLAGPVAPTKLFRDPTANYVSEVLRFLLALAKSHGQVAGASGGPGVIVRVAPKWILAFECKRVNWYDISEPSFQLFICLQSLSFSVTSGA